MPHSIESMGHRSMSRRSDSVDLKFPETMMRVRVGSNDDDMANESVQLALKIGESAVKRLKKSNTDTNLFASRMDSIQVVPRIDSLNEFPELPETVSFM